MLQTIYKEATLPLLIYGAPVRAEAMRFEYNRVKYIRAQRLMNIKISKAFRTTSSEAFCILAWMTPTIIRTEKAVKQYILRKGKGALTKSIDLEIERKNWQHPADVHLSKWGNMVTKPYSYIQMGEKMNKGSGQEWRFSLERNSFQNQNSSWITDAPILKRSN